MMRKIYLASPLFSKSERDFNELISDVLSQHFEVYLPQRDGGLLVDLVSSGMEELKAKQAVFSQDIDAIDNCDILLIVLDGRAIDEGACFELGYAYSRGKLCFGLQTDPRRLLREGNNPMIEIPLLKIFSSVSELEGWVKNESYIRVA